MLIARFDEPAERANAADEPALGIHAPTQIRVFESVVEGAVEPGDRQARKKQIAILRSKIVRKNARDCVGAHTILPRQTAAVVERDLALAYAAGFYER